MSLHFSAPIINKVIIVGNVVNDPRVSTTIINKIKVANFRIACTRRFKTRLGAQKEETCFVSVTAWTNLAEICEHNLVRGDKVFIEGSLQSKQLNDSTMSTVEILADRIQILTPKKIVTNLQEVQERDEELEVIEENVCKDNIESKE